MNDHDLLINRQQKALSVGIIGGGIAGSTIALQLAELGIQVELFEEGRSLVNGPPICHLHAGGNLYREIDDEQCVTLLTQSIETLKIYPHSANIRPTVIAVPLHDKSDPSALLPRLILLQQAYQQLVDDDSSNQVLGKPAHYFKCYDRDTLDALARKEPPTIPVQLDDWMIPVAKNLDLDELKYPLVLVQEYGLSVFRLAATANLALSHLPNCNLHTSSKVTQIHQIENARWSITYHAAETNDTVQSKKQIVVDYLVNACGFQTGAIDDMAKLKRQRLVEFKAAYVTQWQDSQGVWPEIIFHGERGTPNGMAQLTPYPDGFFQLHGMTEEITLFKEGLVASTEESAQPVLNETFTQKIKHGWQIDEVNCRSQRAISHMSRFVPRYKTATVGGQPLFGAQQIPGEDASLRAADISFDGHRYARTEIVKASSALSAAHSIIAQLYCDGLLHHHTEYSQARPSITASLTRQDIETKAIELAIERNYPPALAKTLSYPLVESA
ncbi:NAD(P)-binding protein [Photobacterium nomapromontoriensis]|uniref:NAD(P)-binding protein n=1 Tax=Photobacterium nomapromontoriensis TaxID=2910237 RepID=UPI003D0F2521